MVEVIGQTSNTIFDELEQWEAYLKSEGIDIHILENCGEVEDYPSENHLREDSPSESREAKRPRPVLRSRRPSRGPSL